MKSGRFIGVMSGTSLDGVDVVLATIDEHRVAQLASLSWPIPVSLKQAVLDICQGQQLTLSQFGQLDTQLGRLFADAVNALLAHPTERRMVLNIGGIANLSLLIPGQPVGGYDTGPGNMLMDAWIWRQAGKPYDKDAEWARAGKVILPLLQNMLSDPYFSQPAPKSTGREYFNYGWLERHLRHFPGVDPRDVQATLAELTAVTISEQVLLSGGCERLMVCGGGSRNPLLMARLAVLLLGTEVTTTDAVGISGDDMEALAFAWLAWRTLAGLPGNLPSVTGASQETVLGAIFPANS